LKRLRAALFSQRRAMGSWERLAGKFELQKTDATVKIKKAMGEKGDYVAIVGIRDIIFIRKCLIEIYKNAGSIIYRQHTDKYMHTFIHT
jgi:hypothetical protein